VSRVKAADPLKQPTLKDFEIKNGKLYPKKMHSALKKLNTK